MAKPRILLTGDDGYNSYGTRVLIHCLKDTYDLTVAGTSTQQSAMGGKMSLTKGFAWSLTEVDGVPAFKVDGSPVDAMELVGDYFLNDEPFDLIISGINWGCNLGTATYSSGTVNAAIRGIMTNVAPRAVAMSWDLNGDHWTVAHDATEVLDEYVKYPGESVCSLLELFKKEKYWGAELLNVNFPNDVTSTMRLTRLATKSKSVYVHPPLIKANAGHYHYGAARVLNPGLEPSVDGQALADGLITVTPCKLDFTDQACFEKNSPFETQF